MDRRHAGLLLLLIQPGAVGCHSCTLMYSPSQLTVDIVRFDPWEPGIYELELGGFREGAGQQHAMCVVELPFQEGDLVSCTNNAMLELDANGPIAMTLWDTVPDDATVWVMVDGDVLAEESFEPVYETSQPNGPGCGTRYVGTIEVVI